MEAKFIFIYGALFAQCRLQAEAKSDATKKNIKAVIIKRRSYLNAPKVIKEITDFRPRFCEQIKMKVIKYYKPLPVNRIMMWVLSLQQLEK